MKWYLAGGALIGLLIPVPFWLATVSGGYMFGGEVIAVWPSSFWLMALDAAGPPSVGFAVEIWAMSIGANAILYALLGLFVFGIRCLMRAGHFAWAASISSGGTILLATWVVFAEHL